MQSAQEFIGYILCILGLTKTNKPIEAGDDVVIPNDADILKKMSEMGSPTDVVIFHETRRFTSTFLLVRKCTDDVFRPMGYVDIPPYFDDWSSGYGSHMVINFVDHDTQTIHDHIVGFKDDKIEHDINQDPDSIHAIDEYTVPEFCGHFSNKMIQIYPSPANGPIHIEWFNGADEFL